MRFTETELQGAFLIDLERLEDDRGFFARSFCASEFEEHDLNSTVVQSNVSFNSSKGTLRGMHYQVPPAAETKLVRCTRGAIYDAIVDLRPNSPTYLSHLGVELTAENGTALYVPEMCAHGYLTLTDDTEVTYQVGAFYAPEHERGLPHDDPAFGIEWPLPVRVISDKDRTWPRFRAESPATP
jgi:dTDP-4-dehydrorhamnose 3,5-epimerase